MAKIEEINNFISVFGLEPERLETFYGLKVYLQGDNIPEDSAKFLSIYASPAQRGSTSQYLNSDINRLHLGFCHDNRICVDIFLPKSLVKLYLFSTTSGTFIAGGIDSGGNVFVIDFIHHGRLGMAFLPFFDIILTDNGYPSLGELYKAFPTIQFEASRFVYYMHTLQRQIQAVENFYLEKLKNLQNLLNNSVSDVIQSVTPFLADWEPSESGLTYKHKITVDRVILHRTMYELPAELKFSLTRKNLFISYDTSRVTFRAPHKHPNISRDGKVCTGDLKDELQKMTSGLTKLKFMLSKLPSSLQVVNLDSCHDSQCASDLHSALAKRINELKKINYLEV